MKEHQCIDCRALPEPQGAIAYMKGEDHPAPPYRPTKPRPAPYGGLRSRRCATHWRALTAARKLARHATHVTTTYGLSADGQDALWEYQGCACPCGRQPTRCPDTDHDHRCTAGHPPERGCRECVRGLLCRSCNTYVIGRYSSAQLRALADYVDDPPWPRLRRARGL